MILSLEQMQNLAVECAPTVAAETLLAVAKVESGFNVLAIGVNGTPRLRIRASSRDDAVAKATALIRAGRSVDLGVAQINNRNFGWLGLSVDAAFDPCRNLAASARVLQNGYQRSVVRTSGEQRALLAALSYYNTGSSARGFRNGYVAKVTRAAATIVPALAAIPSELAEPASVETPQPRPAWDVFGAPAPEAAFVIRIQSTQSKGGQE